MFAFMGRILHVDLSTKETWVESLTQDIVSHYLGARGINAYLVWREAKRGIDPLGPDNPLIFGIGPLTGTHVPATGRMTITCKGPATGFIARTNVGGHWATEAKFAGYDHIIVHGVSPEPVYLWIDDDEATFVNAAHLWGRDVRETTLTLRKELGDDSVQVACIGPAGENLVKFASIMVSIYNAAARGGAGTVMGAKKLKAIVVRGSRSFSVADPEAFNEAAFEVMEAVMNDPFAEPLTKYGTSAGIVFHNEGHTLPSFNFSRGHLADGYRLSGQYIAESGLLKRNYACGACPIACHRYSRVTRGRYAGAYGGGPEYETVASLGSGCGTTDAKAVFKANELCNIYGLDTISTGSVIQWAMESFERGLLTKEDVDGLELNWGNTETIVTLIRKIANREGLGDLLANGVRAAADAVGGDSHKWAVQSKGLEQSRCDVRYSVGYGLAFAVNPRGPDHLHTECYAERGATEAAKALIERITGDSKYANRFLVDKRAEIVRWHEDVYAATDALGMCVFMTTYCLGVTPELLAKLFWAASGIEMDAEQIMQAGRRIVTLEKCYNVREGAAREDDTLAWRMLHEKLPDGPDAGPADFSQALERMLNEYYELHGWDKVTSWPTREVLEMLDLDDVARDLAALERLPGKGDDLTSGN